MQASEQQLCVDVVQHDEQTEEGGDCVSDPDGPQWVTRARATELSGLSRSTLRRLERQGALRPRQNEQGWHFYCVEELIEVRRTRLVRSPDASASPAPSERGERAAQVFARLEAGDSPVAIVQALHMDPDEVAMWRQKWATLCGRGLWVSEATLERMLRAALLVPPANAEQGLSALERVADEEALVSAAAHAVDAAKKSVGERYDTPALLARWLDGRWRAGQTGQLRLSAAGLAGSLSFVKTFELGQWDQASRLADAVFATATRAQRLSTLDANTIATVYDGNYELRLSTEQGNHCTWLKLDDPFHQALHFEIEKGLQARAVARLRGLLEQSEDERKDRQAKRREALADQASARREEVREQTRLRREEQDERARERAHERAQERKERRALS